MQITDNTKLHTSAFIAPVTAIVAYALSPEVLNMLPQRYTKIGFILSGIIALFAPQMLKKTST